MDRLFLLLFFLILASCNEASLTIGSQAKTSTVISSVSMPAGPYAMGSDLDVTVAYAHDVIVTGTPTVSVDISGTTYTASYVSGSGTNSLVFRYTVTHATNATGITILSPISLAGGTIKDVSGNDAALTFTNESYPASAVTLGTHNGWTNVKALGPKVPSTLIAPDMATAPASVTLTWDAVTGAGVVASYNIYRSTTAGTEDFSTPLATGISSVTRTYTDTTVVAGTTYYYNVAAVVGTTPFPSQASVDREIKVIVPTNNMALLHRWIANREMCELMGKTIDRDNNYRCAFTGPGGTGTHFDLGASLFIDTYEQGCNYSATPGKCGQPEGCIGTDNNPNSDYSGALGDIYFSRANGQCWVNNNGAWSWAVVDSISAPNVASNQPGLPPLMASQNYSDLLCKGQTVPGFPGTKRLLTRKEFVLAAAWDPSLSDATINTIETGLNLDSTHHCNSSFGSPQGATATDISGTNASMAYDNTGYPGATNRDTLPACLSSNCAGGVANGIRSVRTGSNATNACVSRYGIQDLVGNMSEWNSDVLGVVGAFGGGVVSPIDGTDDLVGVLLDDIQVPQVSFYNTFASFSNKVEFPHALPVMPAYTSTGTVTLTAAQLHGDAIYAHSGFPGSVFSGYGFDAGATAGRYSVRLRASANDIWETTGFRCAIQVD